MAGESAGLGDELISLEKKYWQALKDQNLDMMLSLSANPCLVAGAQGFSELSHNELREMMKKTSYTLQDFEFDENSTVKFLNEDTALVAYKVREDLTVDNEPLSFDAADTSLWVRQDGRWVCALHTESLLGDPFGRDRVQSAKGM